MAKIISKTEVKRVPAKTAKQTVKKATLKIPKPSSPSSGSPAIGAKAPDFSALGDTGKSLTLKSLRGRKVVLFFYPKDSTPGCTREACAFRDGLQQIRKFGAEVVGVSMDSVESHRRFKEKNALNFHLVSDEDRSIVNAYGVYQEKSLYGRKFMGIVRTTFLIDEKGRIARVFPRVKVDKHYQEVLEALAEMG